MEIEVVQTRERRAATLASGRSLLLLLCVVSACHDGGEGSSQDSGSPVQTGDGGKDGGAPEPDDATVVDEDAESDAETDARIDSEASADAAPDADGQADAGPDADSAAPGPLGMACERAAQCDDGVYCNGVERCAEGPTAGVKICLKSKRLPCPAEHACREATRDCDCSDPDVDGDGHRARVCGGTDCDDSKDTCRKGLPEICDADDLDEDCDPTTVGFRDEDGDHEVDHLCRNYDSDNDAWTEGPDCNDHNPSINKHTSEVCDYYDNNCNGWVDEKLIGSGEPEHVNGGLMSKFLPDFDRDLHGKAGVEPILACEFTQPPGYIEVDLPLDCDDTRADVFEGAPELCDGRDNDCDQKVDTDDPDLQEQYSFPGTVVVCDGGQWSIPADGCSDKDTLWCANRDPIAQGCRTDATRLGSCRACETNCQFSCGQDGCDEIEAIALGQEHACARTKEGRVACWGRGHAGRLGNDGTNNVATPELISGALPRVLQIASGPEHSCAAVGTEKALECWGSNESGQLGNLDAVAVGSFSSRYVGVIAGGMSRAGVTTPFLGGVVSVAASSQNTCAVLESGYLACWGQQALGRLANGEIDPAKIPSPVPGWNEDYDYLHDAVSVTLGDKHGCILTTDADVECWGDNSNGQLGRDPSQLSASEVTLTVPGLSAVTSLSAGLLHTCAVSEGRVFCWGNNERLQLGRSTDATHPGYVPVAIDGLTDVTSIAAGSLHNCALGADKKLRCWGANDKGQLANPDTRDALAPVTVALDNVRSVSLGNLFSCAVTGASKAYCWGNNTWGQLGTGQSSSSPRLLPTAVRALSGNVP